MSATPQVRSQAGAPVPSVDSTTAVAPAFDFLDLRAQFAPIRVDMMQAIARVMESQHFILGREVQSFEEEIASFLGARFAVACASGSDALVLALMALGIGDGDEVITTPFTFVATAGSIARVGATPVFVDIDRDTFNLDPAGIAGALTPRTRAVMPVHLFGLAAELQPILELARAKRLAVVEDAAQAIGARHHGSAAGTFGEFGCFSFFPSKNLGGAGDGGLITTQDSTLADKLRLLRVHGSRKKYHYEALGMNSRLDALQAAILRVKLAHLAQWTRARQEHAERYRSLFQAAGLGSAIDVPAAPATEYVHVYNQFVVRAKDRDALRSFLQTRGIPTEVYYPVPLHLQPAFRYLGYTAGQMPNAEQASHEVLALPIYPELKEVHQQAVVQAIADFYSLKH
jgi:dTDP-4-amino-4,6-dideoxygalactose transaminase